jgi:hypothetical protein
MYSKYYLNSNSSTCLNSNFPKFILNSNPRWAHYFVILVLFQILLGFKLKFNFKFSTYVTLDLRVR